MRAAPGRILIVHAVLAQQHALTAQRLHALALCARRELRWGGRGGGA